MLAHIYLKCLPCYCVLKLVTKYSAVMQLFNAAVILLHEYDSMMGVGLLC